MRGLIVWCLRGWVSGSLRLLRGNSLGLGVVLREMCAGLLKGRRRLGLLIESGRVCRIWVVHVHVSCLSDEAVVQLGG